MAARSSSCLPPWLSCNPTAHPGSYKKVQPGVSGITLQRGGVEKQGEAPPAPHPSPPSSPGNQVKADRLPPPCPLAQLGCLLSALALGGRATAGQEQMAKPKEGPRTTGRGGEAAALRGRAWAAPELRRRPGRGEGRPGRLGRGCGGRGSGPQTPPRVPRRSPAPGRPQGQARGERRPAGLSATPLFWLHQRRRGLRALPILGLA